MNDQHAGCGCHGKCGPGVNRRDFLKTSAATAGALIAARNARAALSPEAEAELKAWTATLLERGTRPVYRGKNLEKIAMPMGGIGAGQIYLTGKGALGGWQIVNNFNMAAQVPLIHFGVWARPEGGSAQARLLEQDDLETAPGFPDLAFSGEYPFAWIAFHDEARPFPIAVELEAYAPMIPLNAEDSGLPAIVFNFTLRNDGELPVDAAVLTTMPNLAGWDGYHPIEGARHPDFIAHRNRLDAEKGCLRVHCGVAGGAGHALSTPIRLVTGTGDVARCMRLCKGIRIAWREQMRAVGADERRVYWIGNPANVAGAEGIADILKDVAQGGALILSGAEGSAIGGITEWLSGACTGRVFEDWEKHGFARWRIEGDAFGNGPVPGTLPAQQTVSGHRGRLMVNSFANGDDATGRALSEPFTIAHDYIHLLVGGGGFAGETCVNLLVEGKALRTAQGENSETLRPATWNVRELRGQTARIEILDRRQGGWGHVLVDDIVFSDSPAAPFVDAAFMRTIYDALPLRWKSAALIEEPVPTGAAQPLHPALPPDRIHARRTWRFTGAQLRSRAEVWLRGDDGSPLIAAIPHGKGKVVLLAGNPLHWTDHGQWKILIGAIIARAIGAEYTPATGIAPDEVHYGTTSIAMSGGSVSAKPQWNDFDALWREFMEEGRLKPDADKPSPAGSAWHAALAARVRLQPGETRQCAALMTWHFPNRTRTEHYGWGPGRFEYDYRLGNFYNRRFKDAAAVSDYLLAELPRLETQTRAFHQAFYDSTLPQYFLDAITANASIARSAIYVWLEDGFIGGFEGANCCCPMNCTHVYNYAMSMAALWPDLERKVRETDLLVQLHPEEGYLPHRTLLPLSLPRLGKAIGGPHEPALDGELGEVLKTCREWRVAGDDWLATVWPACRKLMAHVLRDHDVDGDGVIKGVQPNTYDTHLYGSNTFIGSLYLAALRAAEEMARAMGDEDFAAACRARFESGRAGYVARCWNGEFYINSYDAPGEPLEVYNRDNCYGPGCHSDQLLGQWWAHALELGHVLPEEQVRTALRAIHRHNWRADLSDFRHNQRVFAEGKERGLLCASWPNGGRPERPILYCDEVWTGIEYHVAAAMMHEGLQTEALQLVRAARDRYTGAQRNPWSEIECGEHYARAMSSWSLLHAANGVACDAHSATLTVHPRLGTEQHRSFFITGTAWGSLAWQRRRGRIEMQLHVRYGTLEIKTLRLHVPEAAGRVRMQVDGRRARADLRREAPYVVLDAEKQPWRLSKELKVSIAL